MLKDIQTGTKLFLRRCVHMLIPISHRQALENLAAEFSCQKLFKAPLFAAKISATWQHCHA
jgi:hypothetical protein